MTSDESPEELEAHRFFEHLGYAVSRIAETGSAQAADFRVRDSQEAFLVEVKGRGPNANFARQLEIEARAESEQRMARINTISRQVREAADQLAATDPDDRTSFRVLAFVAAGDDPDLQVDQFQKTIYGTVDLLTDTGSGATAMPCFYFTFSDFFRFRHIDAAVVLSPRGARLCINGFGGASHLLRASRLHSSFSSADAVTDPALVEGQGQAYIADTDFDRRDELAVLAYVREKYGRGELLPFKPTKLRVAMKVPYESKNRDSR